MLLKPGASQILLLLFTCIKPALSTAKDPQVQWISPSAGDRYGPGDSILAQWTSDSPVVSPAFKLCQGEPHASVESRSEDQGDNESSETCGSEVYPTVQQSSGTSSTSLAVPNATTEQEWYVVMIDDFRNTWSSSPFYLSPQGDSNVAPAADAQAPLSVQPQTPTSASTFVVVPATAVPAPVAEPDSASSAAATSMLATRTPPPTAAFAVPLSIVAAILLVAVFLSLRHNRKLAEERAQDVEKLVLSRKSSVASSFKSCFSRQSDIEHALNVLSRAQSQGDVKTMPVPLFMPVEVPLQREPRRCTREAYQARQYTEYCRPSQERPPSYRSAPLSSSRSQGRARSLLSSIPSRSRASSRTAVYPLDNTSCRPSLPPLRVGSPLHCSEYEYTPEERRERDWSLRPSRSPRHDEDTEEVDCATHSVLNDYLFTEPAPKPWTHPPGLPKPPPAQPLPNPPRCLIPAPQRLYVRNGSAVSPRSRSVIEEEDDDLEMGMQEVNLYDAVAESLNRARR